MRKHLLIGSIFSYHFRRYLKRLLPMHFGTMEDLNFRFELYRPYLVDLRQCTNDPCGDYGTCYEDGDSYYCRCDEGYTGTNCTEGTTMYLLNDLFVSKKSFKFLNLDAEGSEYVHNQMCKINRKLILTLSHLLHVWRSSLVSKLTSSIGNTCLQIITTLFRNVSKKKGSSKGQFLYC